MTPQETINQLKDLIDERKSLMSGDKDYDEIWQDDIKSLELAKEAFEKQIPKKVDKSNGTKVKAADLDNGTVLTFNCYPCPVCGCWLHDNPSKHYCRKCGQALDWSNQECE